MRMKSTFFTIGIWLLMFSILSIYVTHFFYLRSDISFFLPRQTNAITNAMKHQLTKGEAGKIIIIALENTGESSVNNTKNIRQLAMINKALAQRLRNSSLFTAVENGQYKKSELFIEPFYLYRYLLTDQTDFPHSDTALKKVFKKLLQRLDGLLSPEESRLFSEDPVGIWLKYLAQGQNKTLNKIDGVWFDAHNQTTLLVFKTIADGFNLQQQEKNLAFINQAIEESIHEIHIHSNLTDKTKDNIKTIISGAPVFALSSKHSIERQIKVISVLASLLLMGFLYAFFRSFKVLFFLLIPLSFAVLFATASVLFLDGFIHGITLAFGISIMGVVVDYPIHLYSHSLLSFNSGQDDGQQSPPHLTQTSLVQKMSSIWPMIRLGLITSIIGFSALIASDFSGLRQLGVFAVTGLLAGALCTRYLLPQLSIPYAPCNDFIGTILGLLLHSLPRYFKWLVITLPFMALLYIVSHYEKLWEIELSALSPVPQWQKQQDFELRKSLKSPELRFALIMQSLEPQTLLAGSEKIRPLLNDLKVQGVISGYDMAASYLPSIKTQKKRQLHLPDAGSLEHKITTILDSTPLEPQAFNSFIQAIKKSRLLPPLKLKDIIKNVNNQYISDRISSLLYLQAGSNSSQPYWNAVIPLQGVQPELLLSNQSLKTTLQNDSSADLSIQLLDIKVQSETMLEEYRNEALFWFALGLFMICLLIFYYTRSMKKLVIMLWPLLSAVILTITTLMLLDYSLSIFHLVTLLLVLGLGIDYSIFINTAEEQQEKQPGTSAIAWISVIICLGSTMIMFTGLGWSELPVLKAIGMTASLGAFYTVAVLYCLRSESKI